MYMVLRKGTVLRPAPWCVIREQEQQYLIYNSKTDEMHLIPPTGFCAYQLCDGLRTIGDIQEFMGEMMHVDKDVLWAKIHEFLYKLIERGILVIEDNE